MTSTPPDIGTVALVGSGEYLPPIQPLDLKLLQHLQDTPQVVVLPTAAAPDGPEVSARWAKMGVDHFHLLGAAVEPVMLLTREDAGNSELVAKISQANFVYLSGGKPRYLLETLEGTPAWEAIVQIYKRGGVIAGCSAGAMAMGSVIFNFPQMWRTVPALGLATGLAVIPHFDEIPKLMLATLNHPNDQTTVVGVDGSTALVGHAGGWTVYGTGGVTVFEGKKRIRYTEGQEVNLPRPPLA
jgi:cyanophycinase